MRPWIGKWNASSAGPREFRIQLDHIADIHYDQKGRPSFGSRQCTRVLFRLATRPEHRVVKRPACLTDLLGFEHESATSVQIDESIRLRSITMTKRDAASKT